MCFSQLFLTIIAQGFKVKLCARWNIFLFHLANLGTWRVWKILNGQYPIKCIGVKLPPMQALAGRIGCIYPSKYIGYCIAQNENNYIVAGFTCIPVSGLNPTAEFAMTAFLGVTMPANSIQPSTGMKPRFAYMLKLVIFVAVCVPPHPHPACYKPHSHLELLKINWQTSWDNISWQREHPQKTNTWKVSNRSRKVN